MPCQEQHQLTRNNVFILPSRFGLVFLMFIVLLFLLGTNYQNNLILLMSYLFISVFITTMLYSFFNLRGIKVAAKGEYLGFVEQTINIPVTLLSEQPRVNINLFFYPSDSCLQSQFAQQITVNVPVKFDKRGVYQLPRLTLESYFMFGLFRCWTHLAFDVQVYVGPKPLACSLNSIANQPANDSEVGNESNAIASDNFYELNNYRVGEPLSQVAWKQLAKTGHWYSKSYQSTNSEQVILSLSAMPSSQIEHKLAQLCFMILEYQKAAIDYGIEIDQRVTPPDHSHHHYLNCLKQVASYGG